MIDIVGVYPDMQLFSSADGGLVFALNGDDMVSLTQHPESQCGRLNRPGFSGASVM